jgi:hypothetical protein
MPGRRPHFHHFRRRRLVTGGLPTAFVAPRRGPAGRVEISAPPMVCRVRSGREVRAAPGRVSGCTRSDGFWTGARRRWSSGSGRTPPEGPKITPRWAPRRPSFLFRSRRCASKMRLCGKAAGPLNDAANGRMLGDCGTDRVSPSGAAGVVGRRCNCCGANTPDQVRLAV